MCILTHILLLQKKLNTETLAVKKNFHKVDIFFAIMTVSSKVYFSQFYPRTTKQNSKKYMHARKTSQKKLQFINHHGNVKTAYSHKDVSCVE